MSYTIHENCDAENLMRLRGRHGVQLWSTCKARKVTRCEVTADPIKRGDTVWRPITNGYNRMQRISAEGMRHLVVLAQTS